MSDHLFIGGPVAGRRFAATTRFVEFPAEGAGMVRYERQTITNREGFPIEVFVLQSACPITELMRAYEAAPR